MKEPIVEPPSKTPGLVLIVNSGSSSLKFTVFNMQHETMLARGMVERIGKPSANLQYQRDAEAKHEKSVSADDHAQALETVCDFLLSPGYGVLSSLKEVDAIGHRVVHGAEQFTAPTRITEEVKTGIMACANLAPLHNPANLGGITACESVFPGVPNVAVFDTAFHQSIDPHAFLYAIPYKYYEKYKIRKYGFHGTSHQFVMHACAAYLKRPAEQLRLITCHLGNGCSAAAIDGGKVLDTSMGMTPLAGLVMGTRCGDIDPAVTLFLARQGMTPNAIDELLNKRCGLLGVGGIDSGDMRDIVDATESGNTHAARALKMFVHRLCLYIGGYHTLLGGADAIVLTGGIGENSTYARARIVENLHALGCQLDADRNANHSGTGPITSDASRTAVLVIPTNEELMIARETVRILSET